MSDDNSLKHDEKTEPNLRRPSESYYTTEPAPPEGCWTEATDEEIVRDLLVVDMNHLCQDLETLVTLDFTPSPEFKEGIQRLLKVLPHFA